MNEYRFYVRDLLTLAGTGDSAREVALPDDQAHHARAVLRLADGAAVVLFDGRGHWAEGLVASGRGREVRVRLTGAVTTDALPPVRLTLATAAPKGERAEWLVEQASQLNVFRVQWVISDRGVVKPREGGGKIEKWRRLAIESAKQCHRTHVMDVAEAVELPGMLGAGGQTILWLDPHEGAALGAVSGDMTGDVTALVGPEGGWSEREAALLAGVPGIKRVRLTETVLRIETACAAIAAVVMCGAPR